MGERAKFVDYMCSLFADGNVYFEVDRIAAATGVNANSVYRWLRTPLFVHVNKTIFKSSIPPIPGKESPLGELATQNAWVHKYFAGWTAHHNSNERTYGRETTTSKARKLLIGQTRKLCVGGWPPKAASDIVYFPLMEELLGEEACRRGNVGTYSTVGDKPKTGKRKRKRSPRKIRV